MNKTEIENELLKYFLDCLEKGLDCTIEVLFKQLENVDKNFFERTAAELVSNGFLEGLKYGYYGKITSLGILEIEKRKLISDEKIQHNYELRYKILEVGFNKDKSEGYGELAGGEDFNFDDDFDTSQLEFNLDLLGDLGFIKIDSTWTGTYLFYIEKRGITQFQKWQEQQSLTIDFAETTNPNPQAPEENLSNSELSTTMQTQIDRRKVFVVHGRNEALRRSMFEFLRSIGLDPIEWSEAIRLTGKGSPYVGDVLDTAFSVAQAIVVLMTPDDEARLIESYRGGKEPNYETELTPQPRQNVLIEAGMALGRNPDRTILVEIGNLRPISDIVGRHIIRLDNSVGRRQDIVDRLETAKCAVNIKGKRDWHTVGNFELQPASKTEIETQRKSESSSQANRLSEECIKILIVLSELPEDSEGAVPLYISEQIQTPRPKTQYFLDLLVDKSFVDFSVDTDYGAMYYISNKGRKYLFEEV